ncbi:hypothetical protein QUC31_005490 [Theobroma cacao]
MNMMSVSKIGMVNSVQHGPAVTELGVSGTTYAPEGFIFDSSGIHPVAPSSSHSNVFSLCNESLLQYNPDKGNYEKIGESTEEALQVLVEKVSVLKFSSDRKMISVLCSHKQMEIMFSKGAPQSVISRCTNILCNSDGSTMPLTATLRTELESRFCSFGLHNVSSLVSFAGKETLRSLALALKIMPNGQQTLSIDDETDLAFIWLLGMLDPPREEVRNAMLSCMTAGICVIVVTGDNNSTAKLICCKIGAFDHLVDFVGCSYTAAEFEELPAMQQTVALQRMALFTSCHGDLEVAMTGDGVNDAPALKKADIGIAMGSGTAVAKACIIVVFSVKDFNSASDTVLADDNFATIVVCTQDMTKGRHRSRKARKINIFCNLCRSTFDYKNGYLDHIKISHGNAFLCTRRHCLQLFKTEVELSVHSHVNRRHIQSETAEEAEDFDESSAED